MTDSRLYRYEDDTDPAELQPGPMIVAFDGFFDAGMAQRLLVDHLLEASSPTVVASFDVDSLIDYRSRRPVTSATNACPPSWVIVTSIRTIGQVSGAATSAAARRPRSRLSPGLGTCCSARMRSQSWLGFTVPTAPGAGSVVSRKVP